MDNDNYNDSYNEEFIPKKRGPVLTAIKYILLTLAIILGVLIAMRIYVNNHDPKEAAALLWNDEALTAYARDPDHFSVLNHNLATYISNEGKKVIRNNMTEGAAVSFSHVQYMPGVNQLQLTVRYNEAIFKKLQGREGQELFAFYLTDEHGNEYRDYEYTACTKDFLGKRLYHYRRLCFGGVPIETCQTLTLHIDKIVSKDSDKSEGAALSADREPFDSIIVYDAVFEEIAGTQTAAIDPPQSVTPKLNPAPFD